MQNFTPISEISVAEIPVPVQKKTYLELNIQQNGYLRLSDNYTKQRAVSLRQLSFL